MTIRWPSGSTLWLATDSAYKGSLQSIARKRAALRSVTVSEQLPDFSIAPRLSLIEDYHPAKIRRSVVERSRSRGVFRVRSIPCPAHVAGRTEAWVDSLHRFVNSEGTEIRLPEQTASIQIRASAQAPDGMIVRDSDLSYTHDLANLPPEAALAKSAKSVGETVMKLAAAPMGDKLFRADSLRGCGFRSDYGRSSGP